MANIQKKLGRVRPPRVHITYDVETGGATVKRELPFVVGVLGDFAGNNPGEAPRPIKERKFKLIDRDNFDEVMGGIKPGLDIKVDNTLQNDGSKISVQLQFETIEDFAPGRVIQQVEPLKKMLETRNKLNDLLSKVDRSEKLEELLEGILKDEDKLKQLSSDLGGGSGENK